MIIGVYVTIFDSTVFPPKLFAINPTVYRFNVFNGVIVNGDVVVFALIYPLLPSNEYKYVIGGGCPIKDPLKSTVNPFFTGINLFMIGAVPMIYGISDTPSEIVFPAGFDATIKIV